MTPQRPNFLIIMSDEHAPMYSGAYGHPLVQTPHMDQLAAQGTLFENAYCNTPLCAPSRMSFMTGRYIHHIGTWDNDSALDSEAVTWAHRLRAVGYDVVLSGKQHFVGPDQHHGFRAQLARDLHAERRHAIFPWRQGIVPADQPWPGVHKAGPGTTLEIEVDDQAEEAALAYLRDPARRQQPWALNVSFIAPHFPLVVPRPIGTAIRSTRSTCPPSPPAICKISIPSTSACVPNSAVARNSPKRRSVAPAPATTA